MIYFEITLNINCSAEKNNLRKSLSTNRLLCICIKIHKL